MSTSLQFFCNVFVHIKLKADVVLAFNLPLEMLSFPSLCFLSLKMLCEVREPVGRRQKGENSFFIFIYNFKHQTKHENVMMRSCFEKKKIETREKVRKSFKSHKIQRSDEN